MRFFRAALVAAWASYATVSVNRQLGRLGLRDVTVPPARWCKNGSDRAAYAVLTVTRTRCLVTALLLQELHRARGRRLDVVIGVASPDSGFEAHAWLEEPLSAESPQIYPLDESLEKFAPITRLAAKSVDL